MGVEPFQGCGQNWKRITHEPRERYIVGVDLGCNVDPTAVCVLHHTVTPLDSFKVTRAASAACSSITEQDTETRFDVVYLERMPLNTSYPSVGEHVAELLAREPLVSFGPDLVVDATGVGLPVVQLIEQRGLRPIKVSITAGAEQTSQGNGHWHVAKALLISNLDAALHTGELRFAAKLLEASALKDELANFNRHVGAAGRATYGARTGAHDDLVLAVALAVWRARGNGPGDCYVGTYVGGY